MPVSLYLVVPPSDISRTRPLVRLILNQIGRRLTEDHRGTAAERRQVLFMLDEFPALGRLDFFETALGYMAGYGLRAFLIAQSLNQISKAYGPENAILDNCHVRVAFASNDERTAKRISDALGSTTELRAMKNYAGHRLAPWLSHVMVSRQETARQLLTPGEVMQLPADEEIIMVAGAPPIRAKKLRYFEDRNFTVRVLAPVNAAQAGKSASGVGEETAWDGKLAEAHDKLSADPGDTDGRQLAPDLKTSSEHEAIDLDEDEEIVPTTKDLFGAPVVEADAFDELTTARMFQERGS
jgi:type IV secretion system protein VirD4